MRQNPMSKKPWDIHDGAVQMKVLSMIQKSKPAYVEMSTSGNCERSEKLNNFLSEICFTQIKNERTFVVSQPVTVSLKSTGKLLSIRRHPGTYHSIRHDKIATTRFLTNSVSICDQLDRRASPVKKEECVSRGIGITRCARMLCAGQLNFVGSQESIHDDGETKGYFIDDTTGVKLNHEMVQEGRILEMKTFKEMGVYEYVLKSEAVQSKSGKLVGVRWVDVLKGNLVRSRLVAQEFAGKDVRDDLFAATPPLSATKFVVSEVASKSNGGLNDWRLMVLDVKRAFLYGDINEEIYIHLPPEDPMYGLGFVGRLIKAMYGTRAAPQVWQEVVRHNMLLLEFEMNPIFPCVYYHRGKDMTVVTHVDDFLCSGRKPDLVWFRKMLSKQFELKSDILGDLIDEVKEISFLGRTIRKTSEAIEIEGDSKHVKILLEEWDMEILGVLVVLVLKWKRLTLLRKWTRKSCYLIQKALSTEGRLRV